MNVTIDTSKPLKHHYPAEDVRLRIERIKMAQVQIGLLKAILRESSNYEELKAEIEGIIVNTMAAEQGAWKALGFIAKPTDTPITSEN